MWTLLIAVALAQPAELAPAPQDAGPSAVFARQPLSAPPPSPSFPVKRLLMPFDIAKISLADGQRFDSVKDAQFFRYLHLPDPPQVYVPATNFVVNMCVSQSSFIQYGTLVHPNVLRYDLRLLAPKKADLDNLIKTWEELAFDPYYHEFVEVADTLDDKREAALDALRVFLSKFEDDPDAKRHWTQFLKLEQLQTELSRTRQFDLTFLKQLVKDATASLKAGGFYDALRALRDAVDRLVKAAESIANVEVRGRRSGQGAFGNNEEIAIPARHAGEAFELLVEYVKSDAAITYAPYFIHRATSSVDLGHGAGLYYQFVGIRTNLDDGFTDFSRLLFDAGVDVERVKVLRSKSSAAMFASNVTGRERAVRFVQGSGARPSVASGLVVWTEDPSDEQVDAANSPIRNLLGFEFAAQELIFERPNGMLGWALFNNVGVLQNSAPDNVVADHSVPAPYTTRLQSCISCIRCHGPQSGHMAVVNDIKRLTEYGTDILDDLASAQGLDDLLDQLVGEYEWDPSDPTSRSPLVRSRDDFGNAVYRATAGILKLDSKRVIRFEKPWAVEQACSQLSTLYNAYAYQKISPLAALRELGYDVQNEKDARVLIRKVIPAIGPDPKTGLTILDPHVAALRAGIAITRPSFELIYSDVALRALLTAKVIRESEVKQKLEKSKSGLPPKSRPKQTLKQKELNSYRPPKEKDVK